MDATGLLTEAGKIIGVVGSGGVLTLCYYAGRKVKGIEDGVSGATQAVGELTTSFRDFRDDLHSRLGKVEYVMWGVDEKNGMRSVQKSQGERMDEAEKQITVNTGNIQRNTDDITELQSERRHPVRQTRRRNNGRRKLDQ